MYLGDIFYRWNLSTSRFKAFDPAPTGYTCTTPVFQLDEPNFETPIFKTSMRIVGEQQPMKHIIMFYKAGSLPGL
jgi:hypothetical protein